MARARITLYRIDGDIRSSRAIMHIPNSRETEIEAKEEPRQLMSHFMYCDVHDFRNDGVGIISSGLHAPCHPLGTRFGEAYGTSKDGLGFRPARPQEGRDETDGPSSEGFRPTRTREERRKLT